MAGAASKGKKRLFIPRCSAHGTLWQKRPYVNSGIAYVPIITEMTLHDLKFLGEHPGPPVICSVWPLRIVQDTRIHQLAGSGLPFFSAEFYFKFETKVLVYFFCENT